eukprot:8045375-Heterocapsa_arctica.AAC.1
MLPVVGCVPSGVLAQRSRPCKSGLVEAVHDPHAHRPSLVVWLLRSKGLGSVPADGAGPTRPRYSKHVEE